MMRVRLRVEEKGAHFHVDVFMGENQFALVGHLVMPEAEFWAFRSAFAQASDSGRLEFSEDVKPSAVQP